MGTARSGIALLLTSGVVLAGCASNTAAVTRPAPTAPPTPTATVGLSVAITAVPTAAPLPSPTPTATRFVAPAGPWMLLSPAHGPPAAGSITVIAGNLPARAPVTVSWSPSRRGAPLTLDVLTGPRGNLRTPFSVPAAPPGLYHVVIASQGVIVGQALYRVISRASLVARVQPTGGGDQITVSGSNFLPGVRLLLVAYSLARGTRPTVLGTARADAAGRFAAHFVTRSVTPGEYELRAWSVGGLTAQVADTFFAVAV